MAGCATTDHGGEQVKFASKPLFVDPVFDGAADPVVIYDRHGSRWLMFYTNRRANVPDAAGVEWVHGTHIGMAESVDGGMTWRYVGVADIDVGGVELLREQQTHWAPAVLEHEGRYHMYLSYVPGVFSDWNHPRQIVHLTSDNLVHWKKESVLDLGSDRVIDAGIIRLPGGMWRMWYKDERAGSGILYADSADLYSWKVVGRAFEGKASEGPVVFEWKGRYWMITDEWAGLAVHYSSDATHWTRQEGENLLSRPGRGEQDGVMGNHADVVMSGGRAYLFYFTHPGRLAGVKEDGPAQRRSVIQVAELEVANGMLVCDRDRPVTVLLGK